MRREIASKAWIWFIRVWTALPILICIPYLVAFFYPVRPSESQPMYWFIVFGLLAISLLRDIQHFRSYKMTTPTMGNWAVLLSIVVFLTVPLIRWLRIGPTAVGPIISPMTYLGMIILLSPYVLFRQIPIAESKGSPAQ